MSDREGARPLTIWCVVRSPVALRYLAPVIAALERRGHLIEIDVGIPGPDLGGGMLELERRRQAVTRVGPEPRPLPIGSYGRPRWLELVWRLGSYASQAPHWPPVLRQRGRRWFPKPLRTLIGITESIRARWVFENRLLARMTSAIERSFPPRQGVVRRLREVAPDVVLVSPCVYPPAPETEALKAARRSDVPTIAAVLSWDNLSSKGSFQITPDRLLLWNETQREEASEFHGFSPEATEVTGAPVFDYLFDDPGVTSRADLLTEAGLPAQSRYVLYAVSSNLLGVGGELGVVRSLSAALDREWGDGEPPWVLVRPHPQNSEAWHDVDIPRIRVWPQAGFPDTADGRRQLIASLNHAETLIGLNTSMFLEGAIAGRTCISLAHAHAVPELHHFRYLEEGGFLHVPRSTADAAKVIRDAIEGGDPKMPQRRRFVREFLRPAGLERPAADVTAERIVALTAEISGVVPAITSDRRYTRAEQKNAANP